MTTTAKLLFSVSVTAILSSAITYGIINHAHQRHSETAQQPIVDEAYFTSDVFSDDSQHRKTDTVEDMVKRCESADVLLKAAAGELMPALQPISNKEAALRLVEVGVCAGSLGTFAKIRFPGKVCLPPQHLTATQAIRIFLQWAQNNPAKLENSFAVGYLKAFEEAFPCQHPTTTGQSLQP